MRRATTIVAAAAFFVLSLVAFGAGNPAAPDPDITQMALAASDFSASTPYIDTPLSEPYPFISSRERAFRQVRIGGQRILAVVTIVNLISDAPTAKLGMDQIRQLVSTSAGRKQFANQYAAAIVRGAGGHVRVKSITVGRAVPFSASQDAFRIAITVKTSLGRFESPITVYRVDRGLGLDFLLSYPRGHAGAALATQITRLSTAHFQTAFTVKNAVIPTLGGTAQQGQTLTANPGVWGGAPSGLTYQWNRCNSTGTACTPISGATAPTYLVGTADSGSTLQVTVTGANTVSSASATTVATGVVP